MASTEVHSNGPSGYTPIILFNSEQPLVPTNTNLALGELAINVTDGKLFYKDNANVVQVIATKASAGLTAIPVTPAQGGTGVANGTNNTITFTGNYTLGLTLTGNTAVTFPTSGTLLSTASVVTISQGGTNGTATPTAGAVPYGTGTAYAFTSAGTTGQVLTSNGSSAPTWATAASGAFQTIQVFASAGTFTYTRPSGLTRALIYCTGAGGGAGYGGAGGSGGTAIKLATAATIGASVTVTVGTGGTSANPGNSGGSSSFGSVCSATGGGGGRYSGGAYPGNGGTGTGGDQNLTGTGADGTIGGFGGPSFWGGGGTGPSTDTTYAHGQGGYQGSGGGSSYDPTTYGGNGGPGYVVVWEFY